MGAGEMGEQKSFILDDTVGIEEEGRVLVPGDTNEVKKSDSPTARVLGVSAFSTRGYGRFGQENVRTGVPCAAYIDGYPSVLCETGYNYQDGDAVYLTDPANLPNGENGIATKDADPAGDGSVDPTKVGTVRAGAAKDLTNSDADFELVQVDITSNTGEQ